MDDGINDPENANLDDRTTWSLSSNTTSQSSTSSTTSSSEDHKSVYEGTKPLVLELHDMARDKRAKSTTNAEPKKKLRKKKRSKGAKEKRLVSSSSPSGTSLATKEDTPKEEFYDAHESYHGIPPRQQIALPDNHANSAVASKVDSNQTSPLKLVLGVPPVSETLCAATTTIKVSAMEGQPATAKGRHKVKTKKSTTKPKTPKKNSKLCEGPTCSMFLADLTRKLQLKRKHEENIEMTTNIIDTIIESIANAQITVTRKIPVVKSETKPVDIEQLQNFAPELIPRDPLDISSLKKIEGKDVKHNYEINEVSEVLLFNDDNMLKLGVKIPKMPVILSDVMKPKPRIIGSMHDVAMNTGGDHDVAIELEKHVKTLKKISLIAEEFNQKTAKTLKEIVDSVQEDLIKKLEEVHREQKERAKQEAALLEDVEEEMLAEES